MISELSDKKERYEVPTIKDITPITIAYGQSVDPSNDANDDGDNP